MSHLDIVLFGQLDISKDGVSLTCRVPKKAAALVAYLILTGRAHARQALSSLLWGESSEANARMSMRTALHALRPLLGPCLIISRQSIAFDPLCDHWVDVLAFQRAAAGAATETGDPADLSAARAEALRAAVDLYAGELMADWPLNGAPAYEDWLMVERQRLQEVALRSQQALSSYYAHVGAYDDAIAMVRRLLALEPWQEEAHRQLMELLALRGRRTEALMQFKLCRRTLMLDLGVEPTVETQRLYQDLVSAQRRREGDSPSPGGAALGPRHNLPRQPVPIFGRQTDMAQIKRILLAGDVRLVTLVGAGGVGKTRLSLAVAEDVREHFGDGVWYVPLADEWQEPQPPLGWRKGPALRPPHSLPPDLPVPAARPGDLLLVNIGRALGIGGAARRPSAAAVLQALGDRRLVLVLDGMEPLLGSADVLVALLAAAPNVRLLVTCRRRLDLRGEQVVHTSRLEVPGQNSGDITEIGSFPSVQLFAAWARRVWPEFSLDPGNARQVADVCRAVAGLPLGIALAASLADHLTIGQILEMIQADPGQVTARWPDAPVRHRGLRASCQYSHLLLAPEERVALRSLARLDAVFSVSQAHELAGVSVAQLRALVEWHLVERLGPDQFYMAALDRYFASPRGE